MYPREFEYLFREMVNIFPLDSISTLDKFSGRSIKRNSQDSIWDIIDDAVDCDYIDIGQEESVSCKAFLRKPVRVLFYFLFIEFEGRLFRVHEWSGKDVSELNEQNMNYLIMELLNSNLINLQGVYSSRKKFKEDLKALSSFRNIIMHVNKKLKRSTGVDIIVKRKYQLLKVLLALQQILDNMDRKYHRRESKGQQLTPKQLSDLKSYIGPLRKSLGDIYSVRRPRLLVGEDSILVRTLGENFFGPNEYVPDYFDSLRKKKVRTEFGEAVDKLKRYDLDPSDENRVKLVLEVADIFVQKELVKMRYKSNPHYGSVNDKLKIALSFLKKELVKRKISSMEPKKLGKIKYGMRAWFVINGLNAKNKELEYKFCLDALRE